MKKKLKDFTVGNKTIQLTIYFLDLLLIKSIYWKQKKKTACLNLVDWNNSLHLILHFTSTGQKFRHGRGAPCYSGVTRVCYKTWKLGNKLLLLTYLATVLAGSWGPGQGFHPKYTSFPCSPGFLTAWQLPGYKNPRKSQAEVTLPPMSHRITSPVGGMGQSHRTFQAEWKCLHEGSSNALV